MKTGDIFFWKFANSFCGICFILQEQEIKNEEESVMGNRVVNVFERRTGTIWRKTKLYHPDLWGTSFNIRAF